MSTNGFFPRPSRKGEKPCSHCGETKSLWDFTWNKFYGHWESWCNWCKNHSRGFKCEECGAPVSDVGANTARKNDRPVLCHPHGYKARSRRNKKPLVHGTTTGYAKGCRCDDCRTASNADRARRRNEVIAGIRTPVSHGYSGYTNGCRCRWCTDANAAYSRQLRARR